VSRLADPQTVVAAKPFCFQLNNPAVGIDGPQLLRAKGSGDHCDRITDFQMDEHRPLFNSAEEAHYANGPQCYIKFCLLKFHFYGYVDATRIRIDIVRQRRPVQQNVWNPHAAGNYMPNLLNGFANICGFNTNEIDKKTFEVLQTKYLYMNSKGTSNAVDTVQDRNTTDATTPHDIYCNMFIPMNQLYKQLDSSINEYTGVDDTEMNVHNEDGNESKGSYSWDNQMPYGKAGNVWCVISTDDRTALDELVDGDSVSFDIIRKVSWRDPKA